jgi:hypothetical protein
VPPTQLRWLRRAWGITMKGEITENKESLVAVLRSKGVLNETTQTVDSSISNTQTIYTNAITLENDISFKILTAKVNLNENILGNSEDDSTFHIVGNKDKGSFGVYIDLSTISTLSMSEFDCNFSKAIFNDGELTLPMDNTEISVYNVGFDYTSVIIKPTEDIVLSGVTIDDSGNIETTTSAINFVANITFFDKNGVTTELRKVSLDNTSPNFILNVFGAKINDVEGSDKLIKLQIDLENEKRQILAGIGKSYSPEELINKSVTVIINLEPKIMMGLESRGMVLAVKDNNNLSVLVPEKEIIPGSKIS